MKTRQIEKLALLFMVSLFLLAGCSGCAQKNALKGIEPTKDYNEQSKYGPIAANTREPAKLEPFPEPSFENLIEQFKADVKTNRGDPEVLARKKQAIENPDLLWRPGFCVPNENYQDPRFAPGGNPFRRDIMILREDQKGKPILATFGDGGDTQYEFKGKVFYTTKEQEKRMAAISHTYDLSIEERIRKKYEIKLEGINTFTAAKYLSKETASVAHTIGLEYAERAVRENPNSVEAMSIWTGCVPWEPIEDKKNAYEKLLAKFPNDANSHSTLGYIYHRKLDSPELAIPHYQKAIQLDSRHESFSKARLASCYETLGEWEKAVAVYQSISVMDSYSQLGGGVYIHLMTAQDGVFIQRKGRSFYNPKKLEPIDNSQ